MPTTTNNDNAAIIELVCNELAAATYWEIWQLQKYGSILDDGRNIIKPTYHEQEIESSNSIGSNRAWDVHILSHEQGSSS